MNLSATPIVTARCVLEPLTVEHAPEMIGVLASDDLYTFIGGEPPSERALRERYRRQVEGCSPDGTEGWLNWVIRENAGGRAIGYVQATVVVRAEGAPADLAWLIASSMQRQGFASEAAEGMAGWLRERGVTNIRAHIRPGHEGSARVARRLGLAPTLEMEDGETLWMVQE